MKTKDTESEILKAAEQEFMLKGFDGAKTTSIAHAAGGHTPCCIIISERRNSCSSVFLQKKYN